MPYYFLCPNNSEKCTSSLAQAAESSAECFSAIPACALSRSSPIAEPCSCNGSETVCCLVSQFGMMCGPSAARTGEDLQTLCVVDSLVRTLQSPTPPTLRESMGNEAAFGGSFRVSLAKWCPHTSSWRTAQPSLSADLGESLVTWPQWGMMRDGECSGQTTPAWTITGNESGYLPTPGKNDGRGYYVASKRSAEARITGDHQLHWIHAALLCGDLSKGWANPQFSELLMDWPIKWTALQPLATDKFQQWLHSHGESFQPPPQPEP